MITYEANRKLVDQFGADPITSLDDVPDHYAFGKNLVYSHRDFESFYNGVKDGQPSAIVSGLNASGTLHLGHKLVFDINLYFQKKYNVPVYIPISDDESYVSGKVETQKEGYENAYRLAEQILAYGFNPKLTFFIIDYECTEIYNLAFKLSRFVTMSTIKATYGYTNEDNPGLHFYPCVQSSHVLLPQHNDAISNVLVPIGPDEDTHLRIARDIAPKVNVSKPAVIHTRFLPGLDGEKMSKSRSNAVFLEDSKKRLKKKVNSALSGGRETLEEHRRLGGVPEDDMSCVYLKSFFLNEAESKALYEDYREGSLTTGEVKKRLLAELEEHNEELAKAQEKVSREDVVKSLYTF